MRGLVIAAQQELAAAASVKRTWALPVKCQRGSWHGIPRPCPAFKARCSRYLGKARIEPAFQLQHACEGRRPSRLPVCRSMSSEICARRAHAYADRWFGGGLKSPAHCDGIGAIATTVMRPHCTYHTAIRSVRASQQHLTRVACAAAHVMRATPTQSHSLSATTTRVEGLGCALSATTSSPELGRTASASADAARRVDSQL